MCSECGEEEPLCPYCGDGCYGTYSDPDACRTCWSTVNAYWGDWDGEASIECMDDECPCRCHEDEFADLGIYYEAGVRKDIELHGLPYKRKGLFPFLKLPGEIRDRIYDFAILQDGKQRCSPNHRGTIHTALLITCRQIYKEAGHLSLSINKLCFSGLLHALNFLGFSLATTKRDLVTGMHIEYDIGEFGVSSWQLLMRQLVKMHITHLGLTIKGFYPKEALLGHSCFSDRFKVSKSLRTFDLIAASAMIKDADKTDLVETMRERLIKGYVRPKEDDKSKTKRTAPSEGEMKPKAPSKKAKKGNTKVSSLIIHITSTSAHYEPDLVWSKTQTKIVHSTKPKRLGLTGKAEHQAAKAATERAKAFLLSQYNQLKQYATSLDSDAGPVRIRLEEARKAAEASDEGKFEKLAHSIFLTLEERYNNKIANARNDVPRFEAPVTTSEPSI